MFTGMHMVASAGSPYNVSEVIRRAYQIPPQLIVPSRKYEFYTNIYNIRTLYSVDVELMFLLRPQRAYLIRYCPRVNTHRLPPHSPPPLSPFLYTLYTVYNLLENEALPGRNGTLCIHPFVFLPDFLCRHRLLPLERCSTPDADEDPTGL
jgi:hypothetical protein